MTTENTQIRKEDERIAEILAAALKDAFGEHETTGRFVDVSRIPLICQNIMGIDGSLKKINENLEKNFVRNETFAPVKSIVYGLVALILTAVIGAILAIILK